MHVHVQLLGRLSIFHQIYFTEEQRGVPYHLSGAGE